MQNDTIWGEGPTTPVVPTFPPSQGYGDVPAGVQSVNSADLPPQVQVTPVAGQTEFKGLPVRTEGDKVFLLKGGRRYWITTAQIYSKLGFKFGDEVKIDQATLNVIPEGEPIRNA